LKKQVVECLVIESLDTVSCQLQLQTTDWILPLSLPTVFTHFSHLKL